MNAQAYKSLRLPLLTGGIAAILVSGVVIASLAFSGQGLDGVAQPAVAPEAAAIAAGAAPAAPDAAPASRPRAYRCPECGVIESMREIAVPGEPAGIGAPARIAAGTRGENIKAKPLRSYEITIRLRDGSMRVITDARPAQWRYREPVIIIAGVN